MTAPESMWAPISADFSITAMAGSSFRPSPLFSTCSLWAATRSAR